MRAHLHRVHTNERCVTVGATAETAEPLESQPDQREAVNEPDEAPTTQQDQQPEATTVDLPKPVGLLLVCAIHAEMQRLAWCGIGRRRFHRLW